MDIRFDGMTAVVTGGARGMGLACAEKLVESGARVAVVDVLEDLMEESVKILRAKGTAKAYRLDLIRVSEIGATVERIRREMGEIDVLIQAAGVLAGCKGEDLTESEWDRVMGVNAKGLFFMMQAVVKQSMMQTKTGSSVNFASIAGLKGMKEPLCSAHYSASKGAVIQLTRQAAVEWAKYNIRVNAVAPGGVMSEFIKGAPPGFMEDAAALIPLRRLSEPGEIASGVCFLASKEAGMVTGHVLIIDGGGFVLGF